MIPFLKMHGLGNDFVVLDNREGKLPPLTLSMKKIADRHFGIGCDQVVVMEPSQKAAVRMRIFNADGSEAQSCGNATRCVAWLIVNFPPLIGEGQGGVGNKHSATGKPHLSPPPKGEETIKIETLAGVIEARVSGEDVTVDMGAPKLEWKDIPLAKKTDTLHVDIGWGTLRDPVAVSMGNPHMVFFVPDLRAITLGDVGPSLEHHPLFPERANIGVAQIVARDKIHLHVWERGAGLTLACGTGACAALVAAVRRELTDRKAEVTLPGGTLVIEWRQSNDHVLMSGPVAVSFEGSFEEKQFAS